MLVKPREGMIVRDPRTKMRIPAAGVEVAEVNFDIHRLIRDGDLVVVPAEEPAEPAVAAAAPPPVAAASIPTTTKAAAEAAETPAAGASAEA
jgi:hypothetical protein